MSAPVIVDPRRSPTKAIFFFHAEDGIRDWSVTGVQTCALPISPKGARQLQRGHSKAGRMSLSIDRDKPQSADKPTLYKQIRLDIEQRILTGEWPPGHRIPFEHELMEIGRASCRERV